MKQQAKKYHVKMQYLSQCCGEFISGNGPAICIASALGIQKLAFVFLNKVFRCAESLLVRCTLSMLIACNTDGRFDIEFSEI